MNQNPKYNPEKHHRRTIRLKGYDYSQEGRYFITICCQNRKCRFGKIENNKMILNDAGKIADECWLDIPKHFPNAILHEYVIMPNHVHGIIELSPTVGVENFQPGVENVGVENVGVENFQPLPPPPSRNEFQKIIPRSIGSIVRGFKIGVTKWFRNVGVENFQCPYRVTGRKFSAPTTIWQRNFHEHIIRDEQSYQRIAQYIINNPAKWKEDKFFK